MNDAAGAVSLPQRITAELDRFLADRGPQLADLGAGLDDFVEAVGHAVAGGKLVRPTFCYWGWRAGGGDADDPAIHRAAASLELLHASALVHDDVMDASDRRRGAPAAHQRFSAMHRSRDWQGSPDQFGAGAAILLGDLCLAWSEDLLLASGLPTHALARAIGLVEAMRTEVIAGQYLDLAAQATGTTSIERAMQVVRVKSAKYTVERPLQIGAALAADDPALLEALSAYGLLVGEAFQLRDDVLGVFGDPQVTGKSAGNDIRDGKRTVLLAYAYALADSPGRQVLDALVGDPTIDEAGIDHVRSVLVGSGAVQRVEAQIAANLDAALAGLHSAPVRDEASRSALAGLAVKMTDRQA